MICIAGTDVPVSAMAELVQRMTRRNKSDLARRIDSAIDAGNTEFPLRRFEAQELLWAIERHRVEGLEPLGVVLRATDSQ